MRHANSPRLPRLILSTNSIPDTTCPQIVYCPSRLAAGANMMKNWLSALSGSEVRAIATAPRANGSGENSAFKGCPEPPVPVPVGSPVCAMKPSITR